MGTVQYRNEIGDDSYFEYYESFFDAARSYDLLEEFLKDDFPWERQTIRGVLTRRANVWFADDLSLVYRYSGQTWIPNALTPTLSEMREILSDVCRCRFNSVLGALYPDGRAGVSWHNDNDFPDYPDTPIAVVSLGSERNFRVRRKSNHQIEATLDAKHGFSDRHGRRNPASLRSRRSEDLEEGGSEG